MGKSTNLGEELGVDMEEMEELVKSDEEEIKVPMVAKKRGRPKGSPDKKPSIDSLSIDSVHT